jgi:hypothetical protein
MDLDIAAASLGVFDDVRKCSQDDTVSSDLHGGGESRQRFIGVDLHLHPARAGIGGNMLANR